MTFPDVLALYHQRKYTGELRLHWAQGTVVSVEVPQEPLKIRILRLVDNRRDVPQTLTR